MWRVKEDMGKYSGQGRPPPREMRPGCLRCLAACLSLQGSRRVDSFVRWSGGGVSLGRIRGRGVKGAYGPNVWLLACLLSVASDYYRLAVCIYRSNFTRWRS
jgi:hypothetical protein